jgi:hypothetical protein
VQIWWFTARYEKWSPDPVSAMGRGADPLVDWRDGAPYRALRGIDRAGLAWEWLRRDPDYAAFSENEALRSRQQASGEMLRGTEANARHWGLYFPGAL